MWRLQYEHHVKSVMKSGKPARIDVISAQSVAFRGIRTGDVSWPWDAVLKVVPEDAEPFQVQTRIEIPIPRDLVPGTTLQVFYNPKKPESMVVDPASAPRDTREAVVANTVDIERSHGADTTGMVEAAAQFADPMEAAAAAADQGRRNFVAQRDAQLAEQHAEVNRVRAEQGDHAADALVAANNEALIAQVYEGFSKVGLSPGPLRAPTAPPVQTRDIEAQLEQLKSLKARGALDDEEYKAARQRLLDNM